MHGAGEPPTLQSDGQQQGDNFWALDGRGRPGAAGKQRRRSLAHRPPAHAPAAPSTETGSGRPRSPQATGAGTRRVHTRTGCPARPGRAGPATFQGHPYPARLRPRTPRRPPRPCSGPVARQPPLRARLGSAGLGLLFGRDASGERRLTRGGRAGAAASTLSTRSAPALPAPEEASAAGLTLPGGLRALSRCTAGPAGGRASLRSPERPRTAGAPSLSRASGRAARGGRCARTCRACALRPVSPPEPGRAGLTRASLFSAWRPR